MQIRPEVKDDTTAISGVACRAFADDPRSEQTEHAIVNALREAGALAVSLVAGEDGGVVGHVALSPVTISDGTPHWYGLGPIAVEPALQRQGIGSVLVKAALQELRGSGAAGCVVLGDPAYYERFGFRRHAGLVYPGPPPEYFMAQAFAGAFPQGEVAYHAAFAEPC